MRAMVARLALVLRLACATALGLACGLAQEARILATVFDERTGDAAGGLSADRFQVKDGSTNLRVLSVSEPDSPVDILALVDSSIVGDGTRPLASALVSALGEGQQMAVASFDESATLLQDFTADTSLLHRAVDQIEYGNLPRLDDALYAVIDGGFDSGSNRKVVIVLSGGATAASRMSEMDVLQAARNRSVAIHTVFVRSQARRHLRRLALRSGGASFAARRLRLQPRELARKVLRAVTSAHELRVDGVFALGNLISITVRQREGSGANLTVSALPLD